MNLHDKNAIKNYLGRKTMFKFNCLLDDIVLYRSVTLVKDHEGHLSDVELELRHDGGSILDYDTVEDLLSKFDVFEVNLVNEKISRETIFTED